jgi:hypothetical protein
MEVSLRSLTLEVVYFEDGRSRFSCSTLKLGTVDLDKALGVQELTEKVTNGMLQLEYCLVRLSLHISQYASGCRTRNKTHSKINNPVVETSIKQYTLVLDILSRRNLGFWAVCILY